MTPLEQFDRAAAMVRAVVDAVTPEQLSLPTACTEWDVRAVVNHLAMGNAKTVAWAGGAPMPEPGDRLGDDHNGAFVESIRDARAALAEPGLFDRIVSTPLGEVPGVTLVHMRVNEYLAHAWDIADATGRSTDLEPELAEQALTAWQTRLKDRPRGAGSPFAVETPAPEGATAADRLAAFLGRRSVRAAELPA